MFDGKKWRATEDWDNLDTNKLPKALLDLVEIFMATEDMVIESETEGGEESPK